MYRGWERRGLVESQKDSNIEELVFGDGKFLCNCPFRCILEGWWASGKIELGDNFVYTRIEHSFCRTINGMDVCLGMAKEIDQLWHTMMSIFT